MKTRWRIPQKLAAGLLLVVGMVSLLSAGSFYGLYSYRQSNKTFDYQRKQLYLVGSLEVTVSNLNFPNDIEQKRLESLANIEARLNQYRQSLDRAEAEAFTDKESARAQRVELAAMEKLVSQIREIGSRASAGANVASDKWGIPGHVRGKVGELVTLLERLRGIIHAEVNHRVEADRGNYRTSLAIVYSSTVLVLAMLFLLVWLGYRLLFHPIRDLHQGVTRLAQGNFDSRVEVESGDEAQELGEAFNEMADRLQAIYKDLNRQVEVRSRQLIRSERLASVGFLAAGVAHEINNPLASIAFCGEALESRIKQILEELPASEDGEVIQNYLQMIQQEAFRCKTITEKLLDFSRAGEPERIDTDALAMIRSVIEMVQHMGRTKSKKVIFEPSEPVVARVNPQELKQVLLNLVINALESIDDGGEVRIRAAQKEGWVEIKVEDNGCGMTEDVLENLFEPFYTRSRSGKGTGLGLSISHLIISQHGGSIVPFSEGPNKGAVMTVKLPVRPQIALRKAA
ncbi:HAMP domain-containing protein [bacterium]|nr:HAMP domain-containing protein [bacterium]